jgi:hypothetical protein
VELCEWLNLPFSMYYTCIGREDVCVSVLVPKESGLELGTSTTIKGALWTFYRSDMLVFERRNFIAQSGSEFVDSCTASRKSSSEFDHAKLGVSRPLLYTLEAREILKKEFRIQLSMNLTREWVCRTSFHWVNLFYCNKKKKFPLEDCRVSKTCVWLNITIFYGIKLISF